MNSTHARPLTADELLHAIAVIAAAERQTGRRIIIENPNFSREEYSRLTTRRIPAPALAQDDARTE